VSHPVSIWVYLSESPLLGLALTLIVYAAADALAKRFGSPAILNPVLLSIVTIVIVLKLTNTPYDRYFEGGQFVHFLLGPATVALAIPLYRNIALIRKSALAIVIAIVVGSLTAAASGVAIARLLGVPEIVVRSLAPKAVTTPIAMGISQQIGGLPSLTAALVILSGITGAIFATLLWRKRAQPDYASRGVAIGTASHGIGTARALTIDATAGAFSGLAMGLNALVSSLLVPLVVALLRW